MGNEIIPQLLVLGLLVLVIIAIYVFDEIATYKHKRQMFDQLLHKLNSALGEDTDS